MDFFDQSAPHAIAETTQEATEFAQALQQRETFVVPTASPRMLQALARSPQVPTLRAEPARPLPSRPPPPVSSPFTAFQPEDLVKLVPQSSTLILDIRPHGQWKKARICRAINLGVPSTLMRRPAFSLDKISSMLPSSYDKEEFQKWPSASTIVVYDADSASLPDSSNVSALLTKIKTAGYLGELGYVYGGMNSVLLSSIPGVIDDSAPPNEAEAESAGPGDRFITVRQLSMSAFQQGSTTNANQRPELGHAKAGAPAPSTTKVSVANPFYDNIRQHLELSGGITERIPLYIPRKVLKRRDELPFDWLRDIALWAGALSMMKPPSAQPDSSARSVTGTESTYSDGGSSAKRIAKAHSEEGTEALAMQFYRIELGEQRRLQGVMQHHTHESGPPLRPDSTSDKPEYPSFDKVRGIHDLLELHATEGSQTSSGVDHKSPEDPAYFPFSITAGVEKGHKNRYRNIWPFDHARVRLRSEATDDGSDYINASYIQPRGTRRQYIATQGPLPSTYTDFWTLVWEQEAHVIINLTKRIEGHSAKCGLYWKDGTYGPLQLRLVKEDGGTELERAEEDNEGSPLQTGFDFSVPSATTVKKARRAKAQMERQTGKDYKPFSHDDSQGEDDKDTSHPGEVSSTEDEDDDSIIRRVFHLWHHDVPHQVRTVVQFQYVGWPDLNVPTSPKHLLKLMREVNALQEEFKESRMIGQYIGRAEAPTSDARLRAHYQNRKEMSDNRTAPKGAPTKTTSTTLVHCSAGVGRTGSYILIDAILDAVRREARLRLSQPSAPGVPTSRNVDPSMVDQEPTKRHSSPLDGDLEAIPERLNPLHSASPYPGGLFDSRSSLNLPEMSALSMQSPFSSSPPKQSSFGDSLLALDSVMQSSVLSSAWTAPTSQQPSLPAFKSSSQMPFSSTQSFGVSRPDLSEVGSMSASAREYATTSGFLNHTSSTFEYLNPRQILIPKHSRRHHHTSPIDKVRAQETERRERYAMPTAGPMDIDDLSPPEDAPSPLGELDEPVRQVLEGIREQRMSMCQSLRQYVFVHRAVLEGALQIVDEVKAELESERTSGVSAEASGALPFTQAADRSSLPKTTVSFSSRTPAPPPPPPPPPSHFGSLPVDTPYRLSALATGAGPPRPSLLGNKRLASPTELQRTDAQGAPRTIHKRPSLKRINKSSDSNLDFTD